MKTRTAFLLRFMLPPLYAAIIIALGTALLDPSHGSDRDFLAGLGFFVLYSYIFAGLPTLLFAFLLSRFARRRPGFGGRLARATLMGWLAGLLITAMFGFTLPLLFLPLGTAVGFAVEGTVVLLERRAALTA
jgi:hypothetical protein